MYEFPADLTSARSVTFRAALNLGRRPLTVSRDYVWLLGGAAARPRAANAKARAIRMPTHQDLHSGDRQGRCEAGIDAIVR